MTVATTTNKVTYAGNGATTNWSFSFAADVASDINVYITTSAGVVTHLASNLYTVTLNAAAAPNPTPVGGTVTYPISGSPLAAGNTLTLMRTKPLTQTDSFVNQGVLYPTVIEGSVDDLTMTDQQIQEQIGRQFTVSVSDPNPATVPPVSLRKNLWASWDTNGDLTAGAAPGGAVSISAAMIPVVGASTLAAARSAMGLGNIAVENIGAGLQDDGAGNLRVSCSIVVDSTNQNVVAGFHTSEHFATAAITYTCPLTSTLFTGFNFDINATAGSVTIAINGADTFQGGTAGQSLIIPPGSRVRLLTDAAGTWYATDIVAFGLTPPLNMQINATVATNQLTVALKDRNGNDASKASPIVITFRDPTATNGNPVTRTITSALSIVGANGSSLGTINSGPCRVWVTASDNAGSIVLGLYTSVLYSSGVPIGVLGIDEGSVYSGTAISAAATLAQTLYTNGAVTSKSIRILGYVDFNAGQATAGTWATAPSEIILATSSTKNIGELIQEPFNITGAFNTGATAIPNDDTIPQSNEGDQFMTQAIVPTSTISLLNIQARALVSPAGSQAMAAALFQDATANALSAVQDLPVGSSTMSNLFINHFMIAGTSSSTTFKVRAGSTSGTSTFNGVASARKLGGVLNSYMLVKEIMV